MEESVRTCHFCGAQTVTPYRCWECGYLFCQEHRHPSQHNCEARRRRPEAKPAPPRTSLAGWLIRLLMAAVVVGGALLMLHLLGIVDLYEIASVST